MDRKEEVWSLHSSYKDGEAESCGVFDSPRAMAVGLARCVHGDHQEDSRDELVDVIALAVFDMFYHDEQRPETVPEECRDGYTVYGYEVDEVQSLGRNKGERRLTWTATTNTTSRSESTTRSRTSCSR